MRGSCLKCETPRNDVDFGLGEQGYCKKCRAVMYRENKTNPSSRYHRISAFKGLSNEDIIKLINTDTEKQIADKFKVSPSSINKEIRRRGLFKGDSNRRHRRVEESDPLTDEDELYITYRWMESPERKSFNNQLC